MKLSANKILAIIAVGLVFVVFISTLNHKPKTIKTAAVVNAPTTPNDTASGDTNAEVLRELTAQYQKVVKENEQYQKKITALNQNSPQASETNLIKNDELNHLQQVQAQTSEQITQLKNQLISMQKQNSSASSDGTDNTNYPVNSSSGQSPQVGMITTVTDMRASTTTVNTTAVNSSVNEIHQANNQQDNNQGTSASKTIPYYTIPALSNLGNTVLLTSLIGEVPQGSTFEQPPFPFQALVGRHELLAANGLYLPSNLAGMKLAGYSVGVGSFMQGMACTRSYITKVLFLFQDGHYVVYGHDADTSNVDPKDTLGYLSDPYGNPCIPGKYITNAPRVLTMLTGIGVVEGASQGLAQAQTTTMTGFDGSSTVLNGNTAKYAVGYGASYAADKATDYALQRLKGTFDVVYIPASIQGEPTHVIANFTQSIPIDLHQNGRQIYYDHYTATGVTTLPGLD